MSLSSRIVRSSAFLLFGRLWSALATMVLMPFSLHYVGKDGLGAYSLVLVASGTAFGFAELATGASLTKFVGEAEARRDRARVSSLVVSSFIAFVLVALCIGLIQAALAPWYLRTVGIGVNALSEATLMARWLIAGVATSVVSNTLRGPLRGLHRADIENASDIVTSFIYAVALVLLLRSGYGLVGIGAAQFLQLALPIPLMAAGLLRNPLFSPSPFRPRFEVIRELYGFGCRLAMPSLATMTQMFVERFLIGRIVGTGTVGLYQFGAKLTETWRGSMQPAFSPFLAAAAGLHGTGQEDRLRQFYFRGTRLATAMVFGTGMWLFAVTPIIIVAWMGAGYGTSMQAMRYLCLATMAFLAPSVAQSVARGMSVLKPDIVSSVIIVASEVTLGIALGRAFGYRGILAATVVTMLLASFVYLTLVHRTLGLGGLWSMVRLYGEPLLLAVLASVPVGVYNHIHREDIVRAGTVEARFLRLAPGLLVETTVFAILFASLLRLTRYVSPADIASLRAATKGAWSTSPGSDQET